MESITPILIAGNGNLVYSITACLLEAGNDVMLYTENDREALTRVAIHQADIGSEANRTPFKIDKLSIITNLQKDINCQVAIIITAEDLQLKKEKIKVLEEHLPDDAIITINTESIPLDVIQKNAHHPERIIGLNWVEPAHTTKFLEIISNDSVSKCSLDPLRKLAHLWDKDPYTVSNLGIRSRLLCAMAREAFYLVKNGYATVEDIDRACRNDPGYYLPFSGNCRYMDLMGTYAYGMVMKDLNPDLSSDNNIPNFFSDIIKKNGLGMGNGIGIYSYTKDEVKLWEKVFRKYAYQIQQIMNKYPFANAENNQE